MSRGQDVGLVSRRGTWFRITAAASSVATLSVLGLAGTSMAATGGAAKAAAPTRAAALADGSGSSCHLGNGVKHVVELTFDNVHYFRDNPNVPSDLELMPNLLNFFTSNGAFLSNNHTPLIAHTAVDILTTYSGLYGDRQGVGIGNSYQAYNADGPGGSFNTTDPATAFTYWTGAIADTKFPPPPNPAHDTNPNMVYAPVPPATAHPAVSPNTVTPAPWVPFTKAGCNVGDVATANQELENTSPDIATVFGPSSPEAQQLAADPDSFKDAETADYVGIAVHCAHGAAFCADANAPRGNQTTPSPTAVPDLLPQEPGGYNGFQGLFGHRYVAAQISGGVKNLEHNGYQVTNAAGNLVDLNGNQINGAFLPPNTPGFPGFGPINAAQTLAYMADLLESGVSVVNGYIADIHGNEGIPSLASVCPTSPPANAITALGSGSACYIAQAQYYNAAFGTFFQRLAADGINTSNTLFVLSSDEGDHQAAGNVGRAVQPTPVGCDGAKVSGTTVTPDVLCSYPAGTFGELSGNITGLLATQKNNTTPFSLENDTAPEFYVTGNPGANAPTVRNLERDVSGLTASNPYTKTTQDITNYIADPVEEAILHMVNADPARTPTFALFGKPDYFWQNLGQTCPTTGCVTQSTGFAWDHGDYAAEINTNYLGLAGPGVKHLGLDGTSAPNGPNSAGANSGQTVAADSNNPGTWVDETDIRPTLIYLTGLTDDYIQDGRVITEVLTDPNHALSRPKVASLGACYKQLNSSVGQFGNFTLQASTAAVESSTPGDAKFKLVNAALTGLEQIRDALAIQIKDALNAAAFSDTTINGANRLTGECQDVIDAAGALAQHG